jgi:hypothetical protein
MRRFELWFLSLATLAAGLTGLALFSMKELLEPVDPFSVVNHPWQPLVLKAHLVAVPLLIFAVGLIFSSHAAERYRSGRRSGRRSGVGLLVVFTPLVLSGVGVQVITNEAWQRAAVWLHLATGAAYLLFFLVHRLRGLRRAAPPRRPLVRLASRRLES